MPGTVAVIEGDDASPEVVRPTVELLKTMQLGIEFTYPSVGEPAVAEHGSPFPAAAREMIDAADTTLFGSTSTSSGAALMYLRWGKQTYANVRPCEYMPGGASPLKQPDGINFAIVRENLEDLYVRAEGELHELAALAPRGATIRRPVHELGEGRYAIKAITRAGCERVIRFAFELAQQRAASSGRPPHVIATQKHNMLPQSDGLFKQIAEEISAQFPDVGFGTYIIDDFACRLITEPHKLDVVVMPNLYGDIMSDAAAGLVGSLGMAASGCYGDDYAYFEPAHGTAPDIMGQNIINPTAMLLTAAMMLDHLRLGSAADDMRAALKAVYAEGRWLTPDQGGTAKTGELVGAVADRLRGGYAEADA